MYGWDDIIENQINRRHFRKIYLNSCTFYILFFFPQIGRTEQIKNNHNPKFATPFTVDYYFEEVQKVKLEVYDLDNATSKLSDDDFLGKVECNLAQVICMRHDEFQV